MWTNSFVSTIITIPLGLGVALAIYCINQQFVGTDVEGIIRLFYIPLNIVLIIISASLCVGGLISAISSMTADNKVIKLIAILLIILAIVLIAFNVFNAFEFFKLIN